MRRREAALLSAKEVGFAVLSISISLIAVFLPILLMGGIVGGLFREFTATLKPAVGGQFADKHRFGVRAAEAPGGTEDLLR
jgi:multidrug efflux pump